MKRYLDHYLFTQEEYEHMVNSNSRTYNFYTYENETDNYQQDHYQLHYSYKANPSLHFNAALHFTRGRGYYEQYKKDEDFSDYGLQPFVLNDTIFSTDLIRQKWLDNYFYGFIFSADYRSDLYNIIVGGGANQYDGDHFGKIIWSAFGGEDVRDYEWYRNNGLKNDFNLYLKSSVFASKQLTFYGDIQLRKIHYVIDGIHDDLRDISMTKDYLFFNPKAGVIFQAGANQKLYLTFAIANKEPSRSVFRDAAPNDNPQPERLFDNELGYEWKTRTAIVNANLFYMFYKNQLVMTGQINDVGAVVLRNVPTSFRRGIEISTGLDVTSWLKWKANLALSQNKILDFTEYVDDWDNGGQIANYLGTTDLSFSPSIIGGSLLQADLFKGMSLLWISKYVSRQYIDNTSNKDISLDPYWVNDLIISYSTTRTIIPELNISFKINNLLNEKYETFAWAYRYFYQGNYYTMDGYFPQAGTNWLAQLTLKF